MFRERPPGSDPLSFKIVHERGHVVRDVGLQVCQGLAVGFPQQDEVRIKALFTEAAQKQMSEQALLVMKSTTSTRSIDCGWQSPYPATSEGWSKGTPFPLEEAVEEGHDELGADLKVPSTIRCSATTVPSMSPAYSRGGIFVSEVRFQNSRVAEIRLSTEGEIQEGTGWGVPDSLVWSGKRRPVVLVEPFGRGRRSNLIRTSISDRLRAGFMAEAAGDHIKLS